MYIKFSAITIITTYLEYVKEHYIYLLDKKIIKFFNKLRHFYIHTYYYILVFIFHVYLFIYI